MAGYVFAIGGDTEIIRTCAERGIYSTRLNSLTSRPFEATLADYISMKPGDNVYFFSDRKIYGIGELVAVGPDCKYSNFPDSSACESVAYADVKDDLLVDFGSDSIWYRWLCTFKAAPYFLKKASTLMRYWSISQTHSKCFVLFGRSLLSNSAMKKMNP